MQTARIRTALTACLLVAVACGGHSTKPLVLDPPSSAAAAPAPVSDGVMTNAVAATGIGKIEHLIFIVQENRSFDEYFGTYPGANGYKMVNGRPANCIPNPVLHKCSRPYHDLTVVDQGAPHAFPDAEKAINGGKMNGFIKVIADRKDFCGSRVPIPKSCRQFVGPDRQPDAIGFHNRKEIPNYWAYADNFVLQDHMFEAAESWTLPSHLFLMSGWSAWCPDIHDPMSCRSNLYLQDAVKIQQPYQKPLYAWTSIAWLLHKYEVKWAHYVAPGTCIHKCRKNRGTWPARNPFPGFADVRETHQLNHIKYLPEFFDDAKAGTLPSVLWVTSPPGHTEHPPSPISRGQEWVTKAINAVMKSPDWETSALFLTWDDWGGFYDHVPPTQIDQNGYGIRVPGLMISPYAKQGYIDHQILSFDAYLKLIEDRFLHSQRLNPRTDGRPDSRPTVREKAKRLGNLIHEFDFTQLPRPPLILDPSP